MSGTEKYRGPVQVMEEHPGWRIKQGARGREGGQGEGCCNNPGDRQSWTQVEPQLIETDQKRETKGSEEKGRERKRKVGRRK